MKAAAGAIAQLSQDDIATIEQRGNYTLDLDSETFTLTLDDFEIAPKDIPGWQVASDREITVALDVTITVGLRDEGIAREIVNRVQNMRKDNGYDVTDRIQIYNAGDQTVMNAVEKHQDYIKTETLADMIVQEPRGEAILFLEDYKITLDVEKA